jgi:hypothetical protein
MSMGEIRHVEVKKLDDKVVVAVYLRELNSLAVVTFEVDDDDEKQKAIFCTVEVHGRGQSNKAVVAPDFAVVERGDCTFTVWNNNDG